MAIPVAEDRPSCWSTCYIEFWVKSPWQQQEDLSYTGRLRTAWATRDHLVKDGRGRERKGYPQVIVKNA